MLLQLFVTACLKVKTGQNSKQLRDMKKLADRSKEVIIHKKTLLGTVGRWPRPLNRGGRLMEVVSLLIYNKNFRDFDNWPFNRVWPLNGGPLNGGPLNRGSTVVHRKSQGSRTINEKLYVC